MSEPIEAVNVIQSNARFDREHGPEFVPIRKGFNPSAVIRRGKLTDRKIAQYEKRGYYSADYRQARRELWQRQAKKKRSGNFDISEDGRLIYRPG